MGEINRFLKSPTFSLEGFAPKIIRTEKVEIIPATKYCEAVFQEVRIYSDENYPVYRPYVGGICELHWLQKKEDLSFLGMRKPLLAICSKYRESCVPLEEGDRYKIYGNRLIIMHKYDSFVRRTRWLRYEEFIHFDKDYSLEEYTKKEKEEKISGIISSIFNEYFEYKEYCVDASHIFGSFSEEDSCLRKIEDFVKISLENHEEEELIKEKFTVNGHEFYILLHCKNAMNAFNKEIPLEYEFNGEKIGSIYQLLQKIVHKVDWDEDEWDFDL